MSAAKHISKFYCISKGKYRKEKNPSAMYYEQKRDLLSTFIDIPCATEV